MRTTRINIVVIIILLANVFCSGHEFNIEYLTAEQGLSQNEVTSIIQDSKGFMWFGTRAGLNRYDGYDFVHFKSRVNKENYLSNPSIECLYKDNNGNLWIGTKSGGLNFYDYSKEKFYHLKQFGNSSIDLSNVQILSINESKDGQILIGTGSSGLYIIDSNRNSVKNILADSRVYKIVADKDNNVWMGSNNGLLKLDLNSYKTEEINLGKYIGVTDFFFDPDDEHLWIVGWEGGLTKYNLRTGTWKRFSLNEEDDQFRSSQNSTHSILIDNKNKIWIGTWGAGVFSFDREKQTFEKIEIRPRFKRDFNTGYDIILDIFEDKDKNIWIGVDGGGLVLLGAKKSFQGISFPNDHDCGLKSFHINCIYESGDGYLWVGTRGGGLYRSKDRKKFEYIVSEIQTGSSLIINQIYQVSPKKLWICSGHNMYQLDISKTDLVLKPVANETIFDIKKITALFKLGDDMLIGTHQLGLFYIPGDKNSANEVKNITFQGDSTLKSNRINFIKQDIGGNIWIGTFNSLYLYDRFNKSIINVPFLEGETLTSEIINCWEQSSDSIIWIGTPSGLNKLTLKNGRYSVLHFYEESGLPDAYIHAILADRNNHIWMSTNSGIGRMNTLNNEITKFDKSDGLQGINFSDDKGFKNRDGILFFGGINGFNYFDPAKIEINENVPPVVFTNFKVNNKQIKPSLKINGRIILQKSISLNPTIHLSHKEKEITIEFAALNYNATERNQYKYMLEGYDSDWMAAGTKRSVTYIILRAGNYKFKVKGSNNNNVWNEAGNVLELNIRPAPWKSWYAIVIYILLIIGLVLLIRWNAIKQIRLANIIEMEKVQHEQEHKLNELKLRFFTNISHEFRTPLTLILGPVKEILDENSNNQRVKIIFKNARRLMTLVNQLLEFRRTETDTMKLRASKNNIVDFVQEVCISFQELAKINNIQFSYKSEIKPKHLWFDIDKMEIVLNNLISNAFKYAGTGSAIEVLLSESEDAVDIHVIDNGPGICKNDIGNIFDRFYQSQETSETGGSGIGLHLTKRMVELHKGKITAESIPGVKTEFTVKLLKGHKHFSETEKIKNIRKHTSFIAEPTVFSQHKPSVSSEQPVEKDKSVLIVEDNPEIREYLYELFNDEYNIKLAENGKVGYDLANKHEFDIIISDILMPEMDGTELCEKLKSNLNTSHIPIILLTAKSASQFRIEGLMHGAEAYISKPFNPDELKSQVSSILEARKKVKEKYSKTIMLEPTQMEITSKEEVFIEKVIKSIEENIENPDFNLEDLANQVGMSTSTLYRKLKSLTGQSSNEIIRSIRLKRASQLLSDSGYTISEVAYSVGFNDVKYFRKCFIKQFGQTPSQYRNSLSV
ncbi:MAG: two-component regulator propeller domain-containing protein [Bacteroidota bacterium]